MSEMEQLHQAAATGQAAAGESREHTAAAQDLAQRIVSAGAGLGFGNDPSLVMAAQEHLDTATGGLSAAVSALDEAISLIAQVRRAG